LLFYKCFCHNKNYHDENGYKKNFHGRLYSCSLLACKKDVSGGPRSADNNGNGGKPHVIQGTIYDANGNKFHIANSTVTVHVWEPGNIGDGDRMYNIAMDANSGYEQQVASGIYAFRTSALMPLNGKMVRVDLESTDDISPSIQQASAPGIIKILGFDCQGL
jgi:hypothetical protein